MRGVIAPTYCLGCLVPIEVTTRLIDWFHFVFTPCTFKVPIPMGLQTTTSAFAVRKQFISSFHFRLFCSSWKQEFNFCTRAHECMYVCVTVIFARCQVSQINRCFANLVRQIRDALHASTSRNDYCYIFVDIKSMFAWKFSLHQKDGFTSPSN